MNRIVSPLVVFVCAFGAGVFCGCGGEGGGGGGGGNGGGAKGQKAGKFTIIDTLTDNGDRALAKKNAEVTLLKHPEVDGMVGLWAYNAPACLEAVKDANATDKVKIFSFDEDQVTLQAIQDGTMEGTIVQNPYEFGYQSIKYLNMIANGEEFEIPENEEFDIPARTIVASNVVAFSEELAERRKLGEEASDAAKPDSDKTFAFIINVVDPFWTYAQAGCYKAEQDFQVKVDFQAPPTGTPEEQMKIMETVIQKGYDGCAISALDPANQGDIINQVAAKMPLICHDSDAPDSDRRFYLGTNNYKAGQMLGKLVKERMPEGGTLMVFVGKIDQLNAAQRRAGLVDELAAE